METSDDAAPKTGMAAFQEKLAEIRGGSEPQPFADKLEEAGVDVEVRDKESEPVVEPEPAPEPAAAPQPSATTAQAPGDVGDLREVMMQQDLPFHGFL